MNKFEERLDRVLNPEKRLSWWGVTWRVALSPLIFVAFVIWILGEMFFGGSDL